MSVNSKCLSSIRWVVLLCGTMFTMNAQAVACELQSDRTNFTSTIDYDVFAFDRAGATLQIRVTNSGTETCRARLALYDGLDEHIAQLRFMEVGLNVEASLSPGMNLPNTILQSSPAYIELPADNTTDLSIDFFTEQYDAISSGEYMMDLSVVLLEESSETRLLDIPGHLKLAVEPRAQVNIAGAAGDYGIETYADMILFEEPQPGDQRRFFIQTRSNTLTTMTIRSENGGKMTNPNIPNGAVHYDFIFEGEDVDLSSPWTVPNRPETDLRGVSEEAVVQISEDNKPFFAGEYADTIMIEITTQ